MSDTCTRLDHDQEVVGANELLCRPAVEGVVRRAWHLKIRTRCRDCRHRGFMFIETPSPTRSEP